MSGLSAWPTMNHHFFSFFFCPYIPFSINEMEVTEQFLGTLLDTPINEGPKRAHPNNIRGTYEGKIRTLCWRCSNPRFHNQHDYNQLVLMNNTLHVIVMRFVRLEYIDAILEMHGIKSDCDNLDIAHLPC